LLAASYDRWVETLDALTQRLSPDVKGKLWNENARWYYRFRPAGGTQATLSKEETMQRFK
jgi:hypothetical protein